MISSYMKKRVLRKGILSIDNYMLELGFLGRVEYGDDSNKVTYRGHPTRTDITIIFSDKGRAKEIFEE